MNDNEMLIKLEQLVTELNNTNSIEEKKTIIKRNIELKEILILVYDKNYILNITGDRIKNHIDEDDYEHNYDSVLTEEKTIFELLQMLHKKIIGGNLAVQYCIDYINRNFKHREIIYKILNKNLKCGINTKILENIFRINISTFSIPLAQNYKKGSIDISQGWYVSRKLDGVRCIVIKKGNEVKCYSRRGKEFTTLDILKEQVFNAFKNDIVLDGEICIMDKEGNEDFKKVVQQIRRKDYIMTNFTYFVFDYWSITEFENKQNTQGFYIPYHTLKYLIFNNIYMEVLEQKYISTKEELKEIFYNLPVEWEGLMLRHSYKPVPFKRSSLLLKLKRFKSIEAYVIGTTNSEKYIDGKIRNCCGSIEIEYKNSIHSIGSGLTDLNRLDWFEHPENIIGKKVLIKYFSEDKDKEENVSLRFPIFKGVL
jgi:DNA ligase 1